MLPLRSASTPQVHVNIVNNTNDTIKKVYDASLCFMMLNDSQVIPFDILLLILYTEKMN
jgi:hypothetical protein